MKLSANFTFITVYSWQYNDNTIKLIDINPYTGLPLNTDKGINKKSDMIYF